VTLLGRDASETELERLAPHFGNLHLATHGFVGRARLEASNDDLRTPGHDSRPAAHENPLLVSGIALAGANCDLEERGERDDGVLTAEEIAKLDLSSVDWAVLSACESGLGDVVDGEGLLGLRRVFRVAGARTLITSLWPVQDEAARQWMRALYAARRSGSSTSRAVREASVRTLRRRRRAGQSTHPIYWGAFVAFGHWE
jgi:CHAT domain-containing protein